MNLIKAYHPRVKDIYYFNSNYELINEKGHKLSVRLDKNGYQRICLQSRDNKRTNVMKHQLIAYTFIGNPPSDMQFPSVDHIDGNKTNNNPSNLRWLEASTNSSLRKNKPIGIKNGSAILSEDEVIEICELLEKGVPMTEISQKYNVNKSTISNIKRKKNWKHISSGYNFVIKECITKEQAKNNRIKISALLFFGFKPSEIIKLGYKSSVVRRVHKKLIRKE